MIAFLRTILFYIAVLIVIVLYGLFVLVCAFILPFPKYYKVVTFWPRIVMVMCRWIVGIRWQIKGAENIPKDRSVVFLVKHQSTYETFLLPWYSPRPVVFVYKKSVEHVPIFGWCIASLRNIPINRKNGREALQQIKAIGGKRIREGRNPVLFPEGTRTPIGKKSRYKLGGTILAASAGIDIIPVAHDAGRVWPKGKFIRKPGLVTFSFGPAISSTDGTIEEVGKRVETWIENEARNLAPEFYN